MNQVKYRRDGLGRDYAVILIDSTRFGLLECHMDRADWERYSSDVGTAIYAGRDDRGIRPMFRRREGGRIREVALHSWVLRADLEADTSLQAHVVDGNLLNVRRYNLELRTRSEVGHAVERRAKQSGLPRGVTRSGPESAPYMARIQVRGETRFLGQYATPEEAAAAYRQAKAELLQ